MLLAQSSRPTNGWETVQIPCEISLYYFFPVFVFTFFLCLKFFFTIADHLDDPLTHLWVTGGHTVCLKYQAWLKLLTGL